MQIFNNTKNLSPNTFMAKRVETQSLSRVIKNYIEIGLTNKEIASRLNKPLSWIDSRISFFNLKDIRINMRANRDQQIRSYYEKGFKVKDIMTKMNISKDIIYKTLNKKNKPLVQNIEEKTLLDIVLEKLNFKKEDFKKVLK